MKHFLLIIFIFATLLQARVCTYVQDNNISVHYSGYRTSFLIPVSGKFTDTVYTPLKLKAKKLEDLLVNASVVINKSSSFSQDATINTNLKKYVFNKLLGKNIEASVISVTPGKRRDTGILKVLIQMNNVTKETNMSYYLKRDKFYANGEIKMSEFNASEIISSLSKTFTKETLGRTWDKVSIDFILPLKKKCTY